LFVDVVGVYIFLKEKELWNEKVCKVWSFRKRKKKKKEKEKSTASFLTHRGFLNSPDLVQSIESESFGEHGSTGKIIGGTPRRKCC